MDAWIGVSAKSWQSRRTASAWSPNSFQLADEPRNCKARSKVLLCDLLHYFFTFQARLLSMAIVPVQRDCGTANDNATLDSMDPPPRLDTLPPELIDHVFEYLPALDAYFLRFVSRVLVARAERRVNRAVAQMVIADESYAVLAFEKSIVGSSRARSGHQLILQPRTLSGLLVRAKLRAGSATALRIITPRANLSDQYLIRSAGIFRALDPSLANITAAVDLLALVHAKSKPWVLGNWLFCFIKTMAPNPIDMLAVVENLASVRFIDNWMLKYLIEDERNAGSDEWVATFFERVFLLSEQEDYASEVDGGSEDGEDDEDDQPRYTGMAALLRPLFGLVDSERTNLVFKACHLDWTVRGKLFTCMEFKPADAPHCTALLRLLHDNPTIKSVEFTCFYAQTCRYVLWEDLLPHLLDASWPVNHPVQASLLIEKRIRLALKYIYIPGDGEDEEDWWCQIKQREGKELEEWDIHLAARNVLQYRGRISGRMLFKFLWHADSRYADDGYSFTDILLEEASKWNASKVCVVNAVEIFLGLSSNPRDVANHFRTLTDWCGLSCGSCWDVPEDWEKIAGDSPGDTAFRLGSVAAALPYIRPEQQGNTSADSGRGATMSVDSRSLLNRVVQCLGAGHVTDDDDLLADDGFKWRWFLGNAIGTCFKELDPKGSRQGSRPQRKTVRNVGLIFGQGPQSCDLPADSRTVGEIPVFDIEEVLDLLESAQDALNFASGFLARRPGAAAIAMADSATAFSDATKAHLLERLLALSTGFGEIDEVLDGI